MQTAIGKETTNPERKTMLLIDQPPELLCIQYRRFTIQIAEFFFAPPPLSRDIKADVVRLIAHPDKPEGANVRMGKTIELDLAAPEESILAEMNEGTRYEIKRALKKDATICEAICNPEPRIIDSFCAFYDRFSRTMGIGRASRTRLRRLSEAGGLMMGFARGDDGEILASHALGISRERGYLFYSCSQLPFCGDSNKRALIGRSNRKLHWIEIQKMRSMGIRNFDFGGIYTGGREGKLSQIAEFKKGFGGPVVPTYFSTMPASLKGRVFLAALKQMGKSF